MQDKIKEADDPTHATEKYKLAFRKAFSDIKTLAQIETAYVSLRHHWLGIKFDGYLVILYRTAHGGWTMRSRKGVELYPDDDFLTGLAQNKHLPAVLIGELLTGREHELCAVQDRLQPEKRGFNRNKNFETLNKIFLLRRRLRSLQDIFDTLKDEASFTTNDPNDPQFKAIHTTITDYLERSNDVTLMNVMEALDSTCREIRGYLGRRKSLHHEKLTRIMTTYEAMLETPSPWRNLRVIVFAFRSVSF